MKLQKCVNNSRESREFGVIACLDTDTDGTLRRYVLIAPKANPRIASEYLGDYRVSSGAVVQPSEVPDLVAVLTSIVTRWNENRAPSEGSFWEFSSSPAHREIAMSDSVVDVRPSLEIYGSGLKDGAGIRMRISEQRFSYLAELKTREQVQCFIDALQRAVKTAEDLK
ncbi:MAG: hypothetical protein FGM32_08320 [Candidatus Kapabacteria bacterium]|nr:hypothetical protein [Candidatus Kapabacteria bacterium]